MYCKLKCVCHSMTYVCNLEWAPTIKNWGCEVVWQVASGRQGTSRELVKSMNVPRHYTPGIRPRLIEDKMHCRSPGGARGQRCDATTRHQRRRHEFTSQPNEKWARQVFLRVLFEFVFSMLALRAAVHRKIHTKLLHFLQLQLSLLKIYIRQHEFCHINL